MLNDYHSKALLIHWFSAIDRLVNRRQTDSGAPYRTNRQKIIFRYKQGHVIDINAACLVWKSLLLHADALEATPCTAKVALESLAVECCMRWDEVSIHT